ncbi:MAG: hypothetical protein LBE49_09605 [Deltaproteobacteria bacterium]|jgi:hypothetical protein|nr:hypothetical protein [Deltaproteobacteria bacterium]
MIDKPFDDADLVPPSDDEDPDARIWLYVLTKPVTAHRDQMMVLESGGQDFMPAFWNQEDAESFLARLGSEEAAEFAVQAMHLLDLRKLAEDKAMGFVILDGEGGVLSGWSPGSSGAAEDPKTT